MNADGKQEGHRSDSFGPAFGKFVGIVYLDGEPTEFAGQFGQHQDIEIDCRGQGIQIQNNDIPHQW